MNYVIYLSGFPDNVFFYVFNFCKQKKDGVYKMKKKEIHQLYQSNQHFQGSVRVQNSNSIDPTTTGAS